MLKIAKRRSRNTNKHNYPKVLFLVPNTRDIARDVLFGCWHPKKSDYFWPPLIEYYLLANTENSLLLDALILNLSMKKIERFISDNKIKIVCLGTSHLTFKKDVRLMRKLKKNYPNLAFLIYGEGPTLLPDEFIQNKEIDILIRGEPEDILQGVINDFINRRFDKLKNTEGVCFRDHNKIFISKKIHLIKDLDQIKFPRRDLKLMGKYKNPTAKAFPFTTMIITRGCPYQCTFCTFNAVYKKSYRKRSVENVIQELKLIKNQGFGEVLIRDANFCVDTNYTKNLLKRIIKENLKLCFECSCRADELLDEELIKLMKKAGVHLIQIGVESGDEKTLQAIKKGLTVNSVKNAFALLNKYKIETIAHFIVGLPGENKESIEKTIQLIKTIQPTYVSADILRLIPGTTLYNEKFKQTIPQEKLKDWTSRIYTEFYMNPRVLFKQLSEIKSLHELIIKLEGGAKVLSKTLTKRME